VKPKYNTVGVSIPDKQLELAAKAKAKSQRRSLSNYIVGLIEADLMASSGPENIAAGKDVKMPKDLAAAFVPAEVAPASKSSPARKR
jgi:hypothetical protein